MSIINIVGAKIWGGGEQYVYDICKPPPVETQV